MDSQNTPSAGLLNEFQARRLRVTCQYIDKLLGEISEILHASSSKTFASRQQILLNKVGWKARRHPAVRACSFLTFRFRNLSGTDSRKNHFY